MKKDKEIKDKMSKEDTDFKAFLEKTSEIINQRGVVANVISGRKTDGSIVYALRMTEDPNSSYNAAIRFDEPEKVFEDYASEELLADAMLRQITENDSPVRSARMELDNKKYDEIKNQIFPNLMNRERYKDYLENVPNRDYLGYAVVYCYRNRNSSLTITNKMAAALGVTEQQLYEDSIKNIVPKGPINILKILTRQTLSSIGIEGSGDENANIPMYILSNDDLIGGASVILLPGFLEEVSKKFECDFDVLISSNSFVIAVPKNKKWASVEKMLQFNEKISAILSNEDCKLPSSIFSYSLTSGELEKI